MTNTRERKTGIPKVAFKLVWSQRDKSIKGSGLFSRSRRTGVKRGEGLKMTLHNG